MSGSEFLSASPYDRQRDWMAMHPVQIPAVIQARYDDWQRRSGDPALAKQAYRDLLAEIRMFTERVQGTDDGRYLRLARLRDIVQRSPMGGAGSGLAGEMSLLEMDLADCFCGSGKRYRVCHGA